MVAGLRLAGVDQPQPELAFRPAAAGPREAWGEIALKSGFRERSGVAKDTGRAAIQHQRAPARRIARRARQRLRNRIARDDIAAQSRFVRRAGQGDRRSEPRAGHHYR